MSSKLKNDNLYVLAIYDLKHANTNSNSSTTASLGKFNNFWSITTCTDKKLTTEKTNAPKTKNTNLA